VTGQRLTMGGGGQFRNSPAKQTRPAFKHPQQSGGGRPSRGGRIWGKKKTKGSSAPSPRRFVQSLGVTKRQRGGGGGKRCNRVGGKKDRKNRGQLGASQQSSRQPTLGQRIQRQKKKKPQARGDERRGATREKKRTPPKNKVEPPKGGGKNGRKGQKAAYRQKGGGGRHTSPIPQGGAERE